MRYDWPGNVRELENTIECGVIISRSEYLTPAALPLNIRGNTQMTSEREPQTLIGSTLKEIERAWISRTLAEVNGNRTHAAKILGITRKTLQNKIRKYEIDI